MIPTSAFRGEASEASEAGEVGEVGEAGEAGEVGEAGEAEDVGEAFRGRVRPGEQSPIPGRFTPQRGPPRTLRVHRDLVRA